MELSDEQGTDAPMSRRELLAGAAGAIGGAVLAGVPALAGAQQGVKAPPPLPAVPDDPTKVLGAPTSAPAVSTWAGSGTCSMAGMAPPRSSAKALSGVSSCRWSSVDRSSPQSPWGATSGLVRCRCHGRRALGQQPVDHGRGS